MHRTQRGIMAVAVLLTSLMFIPSPASAEKPRCPQWEPLMRKHNLPVKTFSYLAWRESRCIPKAVGWNYRSGKSHRNCKTSPFSQYRKCKAIRSFDSGLWQINSSWYTLTKQICGKTPQQGALFNTECNAKVAYYLYTDGGGISNWTGMSR
jgi:hypothetical protein